MSRLRSFITELKRRKVMHTMAWYAGIAAVTIGLVSDGLLNIGLPEQLARALIWVCILGFPVTFLLSWFLKVGREDPLPGASPQNPALSASTPRGDSPKASFPPPTIPRSGIHIQTLGGIRIFRDGEEITNLPRSPVRCALLAYVAVEKNPPKEKALGLLWPDKDPELARKSLNQTLTELRKDLGDDWVDSKGQFLVLREDISTDLGPFQKAVRESDWEEAVGYYEGRFLDGFYLPGSYDFEEWQERIGGSVALSERKANTRLIEAKHEAGDLQGALALAKGWAERAPLDDGAQNWFLRLLAETGQRRTALKHAESFIERLKREEDEPLEETLQLIEEIKRGGVGVGNGISSEEEGSTTPPLSHPSNLQPTHPIDRFLLGAKAHFRKLLTATVVILGIWGLINLPSARLDSNKIVCFPPAIGGTFQVQTRDVCTAIQVTLEDADPLTFQEGKLFLPTDRREDPRGVSVAEARRIALDQRAGWFILPALTSEGDSLFVTLALHSTQNAEWVLSGIGSGDLSNASSGQIAARAMPAIFSEILDPGREPDLEYITDRNPAAIALWMEGERFYRNLQFDSAFLRLTEAVGQDSLMARAALKGAQAASWIHKKGIADTLIHLALRQPAYLSKKNLYLAQGLESFYAGDADAAVGGFENALALDPDWNEAVIGLAEVYYHLFPSHPDPEKAEEGFRRAVQLDPGFRTPLLHLAEIEIRRGNISGAQRLLGQLLDLGADAGDLGHLSLMISCIQGELGPEDWLAQARRNPLAVLAAGSHLSAGGAQLACAEEAFSAVLEAGPKEAGYDRAATLGLAGVLAASSRASEAAQVLANALSNGVSRTLIFALLGGTVVPELDSLARVGDEMARSRGYESLNSQSAYPFGAWKAGVGELEDLRVLAGRLQSLASVPDPFRSTLTWSHALQGHLLAAKGDTAAAIQALWATQSVWPYWELEWGEVEVLPFERLQLSRFLLETRDYYTAYAVASQFDHPGPVVLLFFLPESLEVRYRAAKALGWEDLAETCRRRLLALGRPDIAVTDNSSHSGAER